MKMSGNSVVRVDVMSLALMFMIWPMFGCAADTVPALDMRPVLIEPEPLDNLRPELAWMTKDRVRVAWIGGGISGKFPGKDKTRGQVLVDAGFNLIRMSIGVDKQDRTESPDLKSKLAADIKEARRLGVPLLVGLQYGTHHTEPYRKYRAPTGVLAERSCCPLDAVYIEHHLGKWAVAIAEAGADGVVIDTEMYQSDESSYPGPCVCDDCFSVYLKAFSNDWKTMCDRVTPEERGKWLSANKATAHYGWYLAKRLEDQYDGIRQRCQAVNSLFLLAHYHILGALPGLERGLGTSQVPCLVFNGSEYPQGPISLSYQNVRRIREGGIPALYLPGMWILMHSPEAFSGHALTSSLYCDGWWGWYAEALLTQVGTDDPAAFKSPYGRFEGTSADDFLKSLTAMHNRLEELLAKPKDQWPQLKTFPPPSTGDVARRRGNITIDGNPDDDGWKHATRFDMKWDRFGNETGPPTTAWICWDKQALYIAVNCGLDDNAELYVPSHGRDNVNLYMCDGIELFIDPGKSARRYAHFIISAKGDVYDSMMTPNGGGGIYAPPNWMTIFGDPDWNAGAQVKAANTDKEYYIEARIPFKEFGSAPAAGDVWGANICRPRPPHKTWSTTYGGFHSTDRFGELSFR